jgi:DNA-binding transcriptional LysR family regulator
VGGAVRIGYVPSASHTVLPRLLRQMRQLRPDGDIDVQEMTTPRQVQALFSGDIDVGLARAPINSKRIALVAELDDPFCLAVPREHALSGKGPIDLRAAADCTFVRSARHRGPACFDQTMALCSDAGFSPELRCEASTLYGVLDLVSAGLGVAMVPMSAVMLPPKGFGLRILERPTRGRLAAIHAVARRPNPFIVTLGRLATTVFAELKRDLTLSLSG